MSDEEPEEQAPRPARKAKKKRLSAPEPRRAPEVSEEGQEQSAAVAAAESPEGAERPAFAADFPRDAALDELVLAFEQGHYARVRAEAPALAKRATRDDVRRAARELTRRLDPDPLAIYLLIAATLLLAFLAAWYWSHPHEAPL